MKTLICSMLLLAACAATPDSGSRETAPAVTPEVRDAAVTTPSAEIVPPSSAVVGDLVAEGTPAEQLAAIEARVLGRRNGVVRFRVESKGLMEVVGSGPLQWNGERLALNPAGSINGVSKTGRHDFQQSRPETLQLVVRGMIRMGLMHNVFRVLNGQDPDLPAVTTSNVRWDATARRFTFDVLVDGKTVGDADLWLDRELLPIRREQTVRTPQGEMKINETYQWLL